MPKNIPKSGKFFLLFWKRILSCVRLWHVWKDNNAYNIAQLVKHRVINNVHQNIRTSALLQLNNINSISKPRLANLMSRIMEDPEK